MVALGVGVRPFRVGKGNYRNIGHPSGLNSQNKKNGGLARTFSEESRRHTHIKTRTNIGLGKHGSAATAVMFTDLGMMIFWTP